MEMDDLKEMNEKEKDDDLGSDLERKNDFFFFLSSFLCILLCSADRPAALLKRGVLLEHTDVLYILEHSKYTVSISCHNNWCSLHGELATVWFIRSTLCDPLQARNV